MDSPFGDGSEPFIKNGEPFNDGYTPDEILERDETIEQYRRYLEPILRGGNVENIFIRGPTGVGKTAVTKRILEFLYDDAAQKGVQFDYSYLNVKSQSTYEALLELANSLCSDTFPEGTNTSRLRREIYAAIDEIGGYYLLVIDECDKLDTQGENSFLYEFPRAKSNGRITDTTVGVIGISNNLTYGQDLEPRIKSSLTEREIEFTPYNAVELTSILDYYASLALRDGSYTDAAIKLMAAKVAKDTGDARNALDVLKLAIEKAKEDGADVIEEKHAEQAWEKLDKKTAIRRIRDILTREQKVTLAVLCVATQQNQTPITFKQLYQKYETEVEGIGEQPRHENKVRDYLHTLAMYGFVERVEENAGRSGGRRFVYSLDLDADIAIEGATYSDVAADIILGESP